MKNLLLTLLIFPLILLGQEQGPFSEPKQDNETEEHSYEFDARCTSPMQWATSLVFARRNGATIEQTVSGMAHQYRYGNLQGISDDTIDYMLTIIATVFGHESVESEEEIVHVLRHVEQICIDFIDTHKEPKEPEITT